MIKAADRAKIEEKKFWDARAKRWIAEEDERQFLSVTEGTRRRPAWAIDHLRADDRISAEQHEAATALTVCVMVAAKAGTVAASNVTPIHTAWDLTMEAELRRIATACGPVLATQRVRQARGWVFAAPLSTPKRMRLYDRMFSLPVRSWRSITYGHSARDDYLREACAILDALIAFWRSYPPLPREMSR